MGVCVRVSLNMDIYIYIYSQYRCIQSVHVSSKSRHHRRTRHQLTLKTYIVRNACLSDTSANGLKDTTLTVNVREVESRGDHALE